jgi:hypothetical protein
MSTYLILDWAGNRIEPSKTFKTFEDAWDYILGDLTESLGLVEEDYQEYYVEKGKDRESRYLDPKDLRAGTVFARSTT